MNLPSHNECIGFLKEAGMLENIFEHSLAVNRVAVFLAKKIKSHGVKVDVELVDRASLIHDLDKHLTFENNQHGFVGQKMLSEKGFGLLGGFCVTHNLQYVLENKLPSLEHKIVYYADKRVKGNQVVSLQERFDYIKQKYGSRSETALEKIMSCKKPLEEIEKELLLLAKIDSSLSELLEKTNPKKG